MSEAEELTTLAGGLPVLLIPLFPLALPAGALVAIGLVVIVVSAAILAVPVALAGAVRWRRA